MTEAGASARQLDTGMVQTQRWLDTSVCLKFAHAAWIEHCYWLVFYHTNSDGLLRGHSTRAFVPHIRHNVSLTIFNCFKTSAMKQQNANVTLSLQTLACK